MMRKKTTMMLLLVVCMLVTAANAVAPDADGIAPAPDGLNACFDYNNLTNWWRSAIYANDDWEHEDICDRFLQEGWYRAVSGAGGDMPKKPPSFNHCGTVFPIWLDGDLPEGEDTIVDAKACVYGVSGDCDSSIDILIKNCSDFNVYYLKPTDACPEAYCFGHEKRCDPGYHSPTDFTPGCTGRTPPVLTETPTLGFTVRPKSPSPDITVHEIIFQCNIETPDIDEDIWFDVNFMIGDKIVYEVLSLNESSMPAELPESAFNDFQDDDYQPNLGYGNDMKCIVKGKWTEEEDASRGVDVSEHFGFEIVSEQPILLKEGEEGRIEVRSRLPVKCPDLGGEPYTCVEIELHVPQYHNDFQKCEMDDQMGHLVLGKTGCTMALTEENWNKNASMAVKSDTETVYGKGARSLNAKFYSQKQSRIPSLSNLELPPVRITVVEQDKVENLRCEVFCDPHMALYDGKRWDMPWAGLYILYVNKQYDTEVQIATEDCTGGSQTCICAVVIRSGLTVFVLDTCGERSEAADITIKQPPRAKMYDCHEGRNEMTVENKTMKDYTFTLSTKTVVDVQFQVYKGSFHNVYITPSVEDYQHATGLCGYINDDVMVEQRLRNGQIDTDAKRFSDNWKPTANESLWFGKSKSVDSPVYYCGCSEEGGEGGEVVCEDSSEHMDCVDRIFTTDSYNMCRSDQEAMRQLMRTGKKPRSSGIVDEDIVIDWVEPDFTPQEPEWSNGWTEETAREYCSGYISDLDSVKACADVPSVDIAGSIEVCVDDIKLAGDTDASDTHVESLKGRCLTVAKRNLTMWKSSDDGNETVSLPPTDIIEAGCLNECYRRGSCDQGVCSCYEGFSGIDCSTNDTAVPELYKLPYGGVCDLQAYASCSATMAYGNHLFKSANLTCRRQHMEVHADGLVEIMTDEVASYMARPGAAVCSLEPTQSINPFTKDDGVLGFAYGLQLSNDGNNFGNTLTMLTYDSKCSNCSNHGYKDISCVARERICKIQGSCYEDEEAMDPGRQCMRCRYDTAENEWTQEAGTCFISSECYNEADAHPGGQTCITCDTSNSTSDWTQTAGTCLIGNQCYDDKAENPDMSCFICDVSSSASQWTPKAGTCFIDNQCFNNGDEKGNDPCYVCDADSATDDWTLKAGTCFINNQCFDNGDEKGNAPCYVCDADSTTNDWTLKAETCYIDSACYDEDDVHPSEDCLSCHSASSTTDWSFTDANSCFIDARCYGNNAPHPSESCVSCQVQSSQHEWTLNDDRMCYIDAQCYEDMEASVTHDCLLCVPQASNEEWTIYGCLIDDICRSPGEVNPNNTCQLCSPEESQTDWSTLTGCGIPLPDLFLMELNGAGGLSSSMLGLMMLLILAARMMLP